MRFFDSISIFTLALASVSAGLPDSLHTLQKRDNVCGADFRSGVDKASCLHKGAAYNLVKPSTISKTTVTTLPDDKLQCDHTIELQLLDNVMDKSGVCQIVKAMVDAGGTDKATLLTPAFNTISADQNINFLDRDVNNRKKTVVARSYKGQKQESKDLDKAVGNYLQLTKGESQNVATDLDGNISDILTKAKAKLATLPDGRPRSKEAKIKGALNDAINGYQSAKTVTTAWNKVLTDAPHT